MAKPAGSLSSELRDPYKAEALGDMLGALGEFAEVLEEAAPKFERIAKHYDRKVENAH